MRKIFYAGFCLVLLMGVGCALTNYPLMVDQYTGEIVNTDGVKAKVIPSGQVATIWPDGSDNLFWLVKQDVNGDRQLTTYNYFKSSDPRLMDEDSPFYDFLFCHPGWTGCAIWFALDPEAPWDDIFDGTFDTSCQGARSLSVRVSYGGRAEECGRLDLDIQARMQLLEAGIQTGEHTLQYNLNGANTQVYLDNNSGVVSRIPVIGNIQADYDTRGRGAVALDLTNPLLRNTANLMADWVDANQGGHTTATIVLNGVEVSFDVALRADALRHNGARM